MPIKERGHRLVLASSGEQPHVEVHLDKLDARDLVDGWTTNAGVEASKPAPDLLQVSSKKLGAPLDAPSVMVGDSVWDVVAAKKAGMPTIAVRTGGSGTTSSNGPARPPSTTPPATPPRHVPTRRSPDACSALLHQRWMDLDSGCTAALDPGGEGSITGGVAMGLDGTPCWSHTFSYATLRARHRDDGGSWLLELSGEADCATVDLLRRELARMGASGRADVVVDVTQLTFCDGMSAHLILTSRRPAPVTLSGAKGPVKRVLDLVDGLQMHGLPGYRSVSRTPSRRLARADLSA